MPTQHDETLFERYQREELEHEQYMARRLDELEQQNLALAAAIEVKDVAMRRVLTPS